MTEETDESLAFRTGRATEVGDTFVALIYAIAGLVFVPMGALVAGVAVIAFGGPRWLAVFVGLVTLILLVRPAWTGVIEQIRFCIVLQPQFLQVGEGISRIDLEYEAVDEVVVTNNETDGVGIGLSAHGRDLCVRLPVEQVTECFQALQARCPNAIFSDADGREYLNPDSEYPERTLLTIEKHKRKTALRCLAALPFIVLWAAFYLLQVFQWLRGAIQMPQVAVPEIFIYAALSVISVLACLSWTASAFSKSRQARWQRLEIQRNQDRPAPGP